MGLGGAGQGCNEVARRRWLWRFDHVRIIATLSDEGMFVKEKHLIHDSHQIL